MSLVLIAAMTNAGVIGDSSTNKMPWYIKEELQHFKKTTENHTIVMGRKTAESVGPLKNRNCLVLSKDPNYQLEGFITVTKEKVLELAEEFKVFICGGAEVYSLFDGHYSEALISEIYEDYKGDVLFPVIKQPCKFESKLDYFEFSVNKVSFI